MKKIECDTCGRKVMVDRDGGRAPMRYCRRCGDELPPREEW